MRTISLVATAIVATLVTGPVQARSIGIGNAVHGPDNQVIFGGMVLGKDPDPNVRRELWRGAGRPGGN